RHLSEHRTGVRVGESLVARWERGRRLAQPIGQALQHLIGTNPPPHGLRPGKFARFSGLSDTSKLNARLPLARANRGRKIAGNRGQSGTLLIVLENNSPCPRINDNSYENWPQTPPKRRQTPASMGNSRFLSSPSHVGSRTFPPNRVRISLSFCGKC